MLDRFSLKALVLAGLLLPLASCSVSPSLSLITVTPATMNFGGPGLTTQLTAIGTYTQGSHPATTRDITNEVTWTSSTPGAVTVSNTGLITSVAPCTNIPITASAPGFTGIIKGSMTVNVTGSGSGSSEPITALSITPSTDSVALAGQTGQFNAFGTSGSTGLPTNMTTLVAWSSSNVSVATIGAASGLATAVGQGTTQITAIWTNPDKSVVTATATFTVTGVAAEPLQSLAITPSTQSILAGQTSQLIAIGTFSPTAATPGTQNLTGTVAWTSSNTSIASITSPGGLVTAVGPGSAVITAMATNPDKSVVTATATVTVTGGSSSSEPLVSLAVLPLTQTSLTTGVSANVNFIAIGTTGSGGTVLLTNAVQTVNGQTIDPVSWTSSNPAVASIKATGVATPLSGGTTAITAIAINPDGTVVTGSAAYTVTVPTVTEPYVSLAIVPASQTLTAVGQQANYLAIGTTGSGASVNLTGAATWGSSKISVAAPTATPGQFSALANGVTAITATVPNPGVGGNPPDGTVVTASAALTVTITATPEPLLSTTIYPSSPSVASPGLTSQLVDIGTFSSVPITQDVTAGIASEKITISWSSSTPAIATVTTVCPTGLSALSCTISACPGAFNAGVCTSCPGGTVASGASCATLNPTTPVGLVTGLSQGTTAIMAVASNPDGSQVIDSVPFSVTGGSTEQITALAIVPISLSLSATGQTGQLFAIGTSGQTGLTEDVTNSSQLLWTSSIPTIATVSTNPMSPAGIVTGVSPGSITITAKWTNTDNSVVTATANVTVTVTPQPEPLLSITVVPTSIIMKNTQLTGQFLAFGSFSTDPTMMDITNGFTHTGFTGKVPVTWASSEPDIFPINITGVPGAPAGVATSLGTGTTAITVEAPNSDGTIVTGSATFGCTPPGTLLWCEPAATELSTLTVMNAGQNQTDWLINGLDATNTVTVIHCGGSVEQATPGGSVCYSNYPTGTTVTLTVPAGAGKFGGWSANCTPTAPITVGGPNSCTVPLTTSDIVAAIIN
jgi:uncharacterized protein YjdB